IFFLSVHFIRKDSFCLPVSFRIHSNTSHICILFLTSLFYLFRINLFLSDKFLAEKIPFWELRHFGGREAVVMVFLLWKALVGLAVLVVW
ncbi:hypothetical protein GIB67_029197, partial [Kingdonia uniflora]